MAEIDHSRLVLGVEKSFKGRPWVARGCDDRLALAHAQRSGVPEVIGRVLAGRGVSLEESEHFLNPTLRHYMPDPNVMRDMDVATEKLHEAIERGDKIAVFGDYDVDGATSTALLMRFFQAIGINIGFYIPDRQKEGYGPNVAAFRQLRSEGADIAICVDCGTMSFEPLIAADEMGLRVIVVDHHQASAELPPCAALINPNRMDDESGLGQLAAVGVAFFLIVALNRRLRETGWYEKQGQQAPDLMQWLDLVALGTICDVVPLTGINRALATQGLKTMRGRRNPGIAALADVARISEPAGAYHAGFIIGPRINAGGRVGKSDLGTRILSSGDAQETTGIAYELDRLNRERQDIEAQVLAQASQMAEQPEVQDQAVAVLAGDGWHPGVIGIVASRIKEKLDRPTFILAKGDNGLAKGSGRSITGVDLGQAVALARSEGILADGGGHKMAAGLTVAIDRIPDLIQFFDKYLASEVSAARSGRARQIDASVSASGVNRELAVQIQSLGPYGPGNPEPNFALADVTITKADIVGDGHVRCFLVGSGGKRLKAIAFRVADSELGSALLAREGRPLHLAGKIRPDNWQGREDVQFQIEDGAWA